MINYSILRRRGRRRFHKMLLLVALMVVAVLGLLPVVWVYNAIRAAASAEAAEITIALQIVLMLILMSAGIGIGIGIDWMIRRRRFVFRHPQKDRWAETLLRIWGYELQCVAAVQSAPAFEENLLGVPTVDLQIETPHRRGRKPTFPLERWLPIAQQWENRDPIRDAFTLGEVISAHLGTNADGTPVVSEQTYYSTWRDRAVEELQRRAQSRTRPRGTAVSKQD